MGSSADSPELSEVGVLGVESIGAGLGTFSARRYTMPISITIIKVIRTSEIEEFSWGVCGMRM